MLKLDYDEEFDVLYISFGTPRPSYGEEDTPGIVVLRDIHTDEITGVTIFDFKQRLEDGTIKDLKLPVNIDFTSDAFAFVR